MRPVTRSFHPIVSVMRIGATTSLMAASLMLQGCGLVWHAQADRLADEARAASAAGNHVEASRLYRQAVPKADWLSKDFYSSSAVEEDYLAQDSSPAGRRRATDAYLAALKNSDDENAASQEATNAALMGSMASQPAFVPPFPTTSSRSSPTFTPPATQASRASAFQTRCTPLTTEAARRYYNPTGIGPDPTSICSAQAAR